MKMKKFIALLWHNFWLKYHLNKCYQLDEETDKKNMEYHKNRAEYHSYSIDELKIEEIDVFL